MSVSAGGEDSRRSGETRLGRSEVAADSAKGRSVANSRGGACTQTTGSISGGVIEILHVLQTSPVTQTDSHHMESSNASSNLVICEQAEETMTNCLSSESFKHQSRCQQCRLCPSHRCCRERPSWGHTPVASAISCTDCHGQLM